MFWVDLSPRESHPDSKISKATEKQPQQSAVHFFVFFLGSVEPRGKRKWWKKRWENEGTMMMMLIIPIISLSDLSYHI